MSSSKASSDGAPSAVSFSSCGWLMLYNFGVAKALAESDLIDLSKPELLGSSGGSLCAVGLVLGLDFDDISRFAFDCVERAHGGLSGAFELRTYAAACIDRQWSKLASEKSSNISIPPSRDDRSEISNTCTDKDDEDVDEDGGVPKFKYDSNHLEGVEDVLLGRVTVSVTTLPWLRNKRYSSFDSMEHVKTVLLASCTATPLAGFPFKLDGEWVIDGGLADFQPLSDSLPRRSTVTVSPFYCSHADIRPSRYIPLWWAIYPPRKSDFEWVFALGYDDANTWLATLQQKNALKVAQKVNKKSALKGGASTQSSSWWNRADSMGDLKDTSRFPSDASQGKWAFDPLPALIRSTSSRSGPEDDSVSLSRSTASSACTSATITPNSPLFFGDDHPTMSYASIWPYARGSHLDGDSDTGQSSAKAPPHTKRYSEFSFQRVFGYRSVLRIIPSGALDLVLIATVFLLFQPFAFFLVYLELLFRIVLLCVASLFHMSVLTLVSTQDRLVGAWVKFLMPIRVLFKLICDEFSVLQRMGRPMSADEAMRATNEAADATAAQAVAIARRRALAKRARRSRRDVKRRLKASIRALFNPILFLRMLPFLGKFLTGDAYSLRRSLCELSVVYRVCVHFL
eukprot:CAMPEP_0114328768 /NCGR_PEP_ID=MMETSP0101-20121206/623_1 /TAXON_ID=38822 ORGANISM="Pteridomonas danica, Strain PT" /NCGR_SAMPLE_ID=MMETSP0101 /ASSEMBLY_ACC=CAM_ASM_000211 /LENGTH=625 /DNA_ID=CAMNT_0001458193 /DNA_START=103 /DNA_END=1980 /DNA_ORIENTATION=+